MEPNEKLFHCEDCGRTEDVKAGGEEPQCCGKPMNLGPLPQCTSAPNSEMVRNDFLDEACDDNRGANS